MKMPSDYKIDLTQEAIEKERKEQFKRVQEAFPIYKEALEEQEVEAEPDFGPVIEEPASQEQSSYVQSFM